MRELAGQDDPLLIAAGKHGCPHIEGRRRKMEPRGASLHVGGKAGPIEVEPAAIAAAAAEHQILAHCQTRDQRQGQGVVRDAGNSAFTDARD